MVKLEPYLVGEQYKTDVWAATSQVIGEMLKLAKKKRELVIRFRKLLEKCAQFGFSELPANLMRNEGDAVYAIGDRRGPLLRAAGFFVEGEPKETFALMVFFEKHATKPRGNEKEQFRKLARIRDDHQWTLVEETV
jgi:hypothetical protein